jgi:superfamily II DNA or RNA helicase
VPRKLAEGVYEHLVTRGLAGTLLGLAPAHGDVRALSETYVPDFLAKNVAAGTAPRLLFLAHRRELLDQARATFRQVLRDASFGELLYDGESPDRWEHVFATVQRAATILGDRFAPEHFRHVVIDECHHAPADSYQRIVHFVRPKILLGLTATPERTDGKSLLPDLDGRIAAEMRLCHARTTASRSIRVLRNL